MAHIDWEKLGFNFGNWDEKKVWQYNLPLTEINIAELLWHFDIPYYSNDSGDEFTVNAWDIINRKAGTDTEYSRTENADTSYPLDILRYENRWFILDGIHRLIRLYRKGEKRIKVREFPLEKLPEIIVS